MERLLGPDLNSRLAYVPVAGALLSAAGASAVVFANPVGPTLADIQIYNGTSIPAGPVPNSTLTVDSDSLIPRFWFPENTDIVYIEVNGGTRTPANADYDYRIDNASGFVNGPLVSTGIIAGGNINLNLSDPKSIDITPLIGYIVDYATDPLQPTITPVRTTSTLTVQLNAQAQTRVVTWWLMDSAGAVIQQAHRPTNVQRRTHLQLGATAYDTNTGTLFIDQSLPVILAQPVNQFYDLMYALGSFSVTGNKIGPNGANLTCAKTAGVLFSPSFNHFPGINDPHISSIPGQAPVTFRHVTRIAPLITAPLVTNVDVANFDNNGVLTPIGGSANSSTIIRVWAFATEAVVDQIVLQYGQTVYPSLAAAVLATGTTNFVVNPAIEGSGALIGYIVAIRTAVNLSDPAQASFLNASKFSTP